MNISLDFVDVLDFILNSNSRRTQNLVSVIGLCIAISGENVYFTSHRFSLECTLYSRVLCAIQNVLARSGSDFHLDPNV